ncbi:MAG: hypothetical protein K6L80_07495 [Agarilytica sp.]
MIVDKYILDNIEIFTVQPFSFDISTLELWALLAALLSLILAPLGIGISLFKIQRSIVKPNTPFKASEHSVIKMYFSGCLVFFPLAYFTFAYYLDGSFLG